jgi:hypothetical protein
MRRGGAHQLRANDGCMLVASVLLWPHQELEQRVSRQHMPDQCSRLELQPIGPLPGPPPEQSIGSRGVSQLQRSG